MQEIIVFDLDGTLALIEHRQHLVQCDKPDWDAFFEACVDDLPNTPVIKVLREMHSRNVVEIWSGRSDAVRLETREWLTRHGVPVNVYVQMRAEGDYTPDEQLKESWLNSSRGDDVEVTMVFDDRDKVVAMWRRNGVVCAQVAPGAF